MPSPLNLDLLCLLSMIHRVKINCFAKIAPPPKKNRRPNAQKRTPVQPTTSTADSSLNGDADTGSESLGVPSYR